MLITKEITFTSVLLLTIALPAAALSAPSATNKTKCTEFVKECFAYGDEERTSCYYQAASHSACQGTTLSTLLMQRWSMNPSEAAPDAKGLNFIGTQLVNQECLSRFDSKLSAWSISEENPTTEYSLKELSKFLESCRTVEPDSLTRP